MKKNDELSESLEDYLEIILQLEQSQKVARAKDIAANMEIQRGSVTSALKNLKEKKLINYEPYSFITLTPKGKKLAKEITHRHTVLRDFLLMILQLDEETAEATACRMEHVIDNKSLEKLLLFFDFIYNCPRAGKDWVEAFLDYCSSGKLDREKCERCLDDCHTRHQ
ncbi:MAG: metal-dependent transcriptional regulator [Desulfobacterales bacterium]|uniref:Transcriptional regulator MntR n=1 Tax=Candidatus Desulfatibia vada TaxID=2841696 RepID=A0A8J6P0E3_9BACT|nr:metal-dependent transcriptional regulator [Candidatus Desulfatibia vada]MBL6970613.1 metal-dependent transcriptional regulator [Desulfobacterales bacterium]